VIEMKYLKTFEKAIIWALRLKKIKKPQPFVLRVEGRL